MGTGFKTKCSECGYSKSFMLGIGMMYDLYSSSNFDSPYGLLPRLIKSRKTMNQIKMLAEEKHGQVENETYGHYIFRCEKCGALYNRFYCRINYEGGDYETKYRCTKCKKELTKLYIDRDEEILNYPCPKCGKTTLHIDAYMLWD